MECCTIEIKLLLELLKFFDFWESLQIVIVFWTIISFVFPNEDRFLQGVKILRSFINIRNLIIYSNELRKTENIFLSSRNRLASERKLKKNRIT